MGLVGVAGFAMLVGVQPALSLLANESASVITNLDLAVIPLFLLMGSLASAAGLATDLYNLAYALTGHRRGGLSLATIGGCAGFGAICGSGVATAATFGRVALPEMLKRGYSQPLATGTIAAGGTLGIIIPPSTIMVIYATLTEQFIVDLFIAAIVPAVFAVTFYVIAILIYVNFVDRKSGPAGPRMSWPERLKAVKANWGVLFLATVVLGGIYSGIFTVNEAAAIGVTIALLIAIFRRRLTWSVFLRVLAESSATTMMIYIMIIGASIFSYFMTVTHAPDRLVEAVTSLPLPGIAIIFILLILYIVLGAVFDEVAAMVITLPLVLPLIKYFGYDLVWWGIINVIVIEIGMICPPIGINVFVIGAVSKDIPISAIYRGIMPFLFADFARLAILTMFPPLTLSMLYLLK
jgi:tripartite ATP-independent transporter DctM subunit